MTSAVFHGIVPNFYRCDEGVWAMAIIPQLDRIDSFSSSMHIEHVPEKFLKVVSGMIKRILLL